MALTVARHYVAATGAGGLSPLQEALLNSPQRIRIADAPTGAGKSYAFQKAVMNDERVLFIVPTRRLAQNLASSLIRDLIIDASWSREQAEAKVEIWSSDRSAELREQGVARIGGYRIRQIGGLDNTRQGGEMIVAIPEVLSHLLLQRRMEAGQAAAGIFDVLDFFDHIVFDEFHTIEARGFGLAALCARLASAENPDGTRFGRARVSFLSATPLDIKSVLNRLGISDADIAQLSETLTGEGRPVHGDVALEFVETDSLAALVARYVETIAAEVNGNRQVVFIYNRLDDLFGELPGLLQTLQGAGISAERVLVINSISDSGPDRVHRLGCRTGRRSPDEFSVLIATASIEMGVTFREANLMLMEPGFTPMNFLQRYGRAARRGRDGAVIVRRDKALSARNPWLRDLISWSDAHDSQRVRIGDLTEQLSKATRKAFSSFSDDEPRYFGALPNRAIYTAGLYWNAFMRHPSNTGPRREHLRNHQPRSARLIYSQLRQVRAMEKDRQFGESARFWCNRFEQQAYILRDIAKRLRVVQGDGSSVEVEPTFLERVTDILDTFPTQTGPDGRDEIRLRGDLEDYFRDERKRVNRMVTVYFPHSSQTAQLQAGDGLVDAWCRNLRGRGGIDGVAWDDYPDAMKAAEKLVRLTGLVPGDDNELSLAASSCVL